MLYNRIANPILVLPTNADNRVVLCSWKPSDRYFDIVNPGDTREVIIAENESNNRFIRKELRLTVSHLFRISFGGTNCLKSFEGSDLVKSATISLTVGLVRPAFQLTTINCLNWRLSFDYFWISDSNWLRVKCGRLNAGAIPRVLHCIDQSVVERGEAKVWAVGWPPNGVTRRQYLLFVDPIGNTIEYVVLIAFDDQFGCVGERTVFVIDGIARYEHQLGTVRLRTPTGELQIRFGRFVGWSDEWCLSDRPLQRLDLPFNYLGLIP